MTSVIIVGDTHLSDKAPTSRTSDYTMQILDKIRFVSSKAIELDVPLVFAGDIFHIKTPSKNSHWLVGAFHEALQGVRTFIVPGNHDLLGDRLDTIDRQPIGALARMNNVSLLMGRDDELQSIVGIPYLTEFDGGNWEHAIEYWNEIIGEPELIVTHAPIFPAGQQPGVYASIDADAWAEYFIGIPATYYGHIHENYSVYMNTDQTMMFCNQGALSRGSLHESSISRKPAVTYWHDGTFERIEVPHLPANEVFLFDAATQAVKSKDSAKAFTDALGQTQLVELTLENVRETLRSQIKDKAVLVVIEDCLEAVAQ